MSYRLILSAGLVIVTICFAPTAQASDTCQRATGGKCTVGKTTAPSKPKAGTVTKKQTWQKRPSNKKGREDYSESEREKMMERARAICSKEFGKPSRVYRIDYKQGRVWCTPASY